MSGEKVPNIDVEKQDDGSSCKENEESYENLKEKSPVEINGSLLVLYAVFFLMFVVGWINLNNCPVAGLIPIYLIVAGFVGAVVKFISTTTNRVLFDVTIALVVFYFIWHCLGTYWVYKEYQPNYTEISGGLYCNRMTYLLAFWILTLQHTLLGLGLLLTGCYMLMRGDFKKK